MPGFTDNLTAWGYILSVLAAILCIIYGLISWKKGIEEDHLRTAERECEEIKGAKKAPNQNSNF